MALFEVEGSRLIPAQLGHTVEGPIGEDILELVRRQVLDIIHFPLFPVAWSDSSQRYDPQAPPHLTALDVSGKIVCVEVLDNLDATALIGALSRLAESASQSWFDLADGYHSGVNAFRAGWMRFRDSLPPSSVAVPRLILLVGSIDEGTGPALEALASSGVEVQEISVHAFPSGRYFLDVQDVKLDRDPRVSQAAIAMSTMPEQLQSSHQNSAGHPLGVNAADYSDIAPLPPHRKRRSSWIPEIPPLADTDLPDTVSNTPHAEYATEKVRVAPPVPVVQPLPPATPRGTYAVTGQFAVPMGQQAVRPASATRPEPAQPVEPPVPHAQSIHQLTTDREGLRSLAQVAGGSMSLVLSSMPHTAVRARLSEQGTIIVNGIEFNDPHAALVQVGLTGIDGWKEWRIGSYLGPTLEEALDELNRDIARLNERGPHRQF